MRVLLDIAPGDVGFSGATSACGVALDPGRSYEAHRVGRRVKLRSSGGKPLANCGRKLRAAGARQDHDRRPRHLPRRPGGGADRKRRRLAQRRQRARARAVRERRDAERGAALLADRGAESAGGRGPLDRPHRRRRRQRLRPLRRHPQPGLRGTRKRVRPHQRRGRRDPRPGRDVRRRGRRRPSTRPAPAATPRASSNVFGSPRPLPGRRPRPLRLLLPAAQLDARLQRPGDQLHASAATCRAS